MATRVDNGSITTLTSEPFLAQVFNSALDMQVELPNDVNTSLQDIGQSIPSILEMSNNQTGESFGGTTYCLLASATSIEILNFVPVPAVLYRISFIFSYPNTNS